MVLNPIVNRGPADEHQFVFVEIKENPVTKNVSVVITSNKLFGFVNGEIRKAINAGCGEKFERVRAFNPHIRHVVGLVEENAGFLPGTLFIPPV